MIVNGKWPRYRHQHLLGQDGSVLRTDELGENDGELVSADSCHGVAGTQDGRNAFGDVTQ